MDYQGKLTSQSPKKKYKIVYPGPSSTYLISVVISNVKPFVKTVDGVKIQLKGIIIDHALFLYETDDKDEAFYLTAILNSTTLDNLIKPLQSTGQFGPRNIHKKPLEFPIPLFDASNPLHRQLAELSKLCHQKVANILPALSQKYQSIGKIRAEIKKQLKHELQQIDTITKQLLQKTK